MKIYEVENISQRIFVIGLDEHISGGEIKLDGNKKPLNVCFNQGKTIRVTEACGKKLETYKGEIKVLKVINKKDKKEAS